MLRKVTTANTMPPFNRVSEDEASLKQKLNKNELKVEL